MSNSSWFGSGSSSTSSFMSSLAKSAMAEAQKTIDRAREMKEEYEAQERERLAALKESRGQDDDEVEEETMIADFDGVMWGFPTGPSKPDQSQEIVRSESEPVSLQPKSQSFLVEEASDERRRASGPSSESNNDNNDGFTSHDLVAAVTDRSGSVVSPISSIEVLSAYTAENDPVNTSMSSSSGATVLNTSTGQREPGEGQEADELGDVPSSGSGFDHISEESSSKSYEIITNSSPPAGKKPDSSGHTSGDEIELATNTTSSDIEVICSPVEESVKQSVSSPTAPIKHLAKAKSNRVKEEDYLMGHLITFKEFFDDEEGHLRTGSEISVGSQESSQSEIDRLLRKLSEMSEILDARETKLVEMSRSNFELQEKTTDLESQVREAKRINARLQESSITSDEFTQRLSSMEKKLQQVSLERDKLRSENEKLKKEAASRMSKAQVDEILAEKDEEIRDLRTEGENLSKQVGKQTEISRKLKSKDKSNEKEISGLKDKLARVSDENDRLKKNLSSKNEVESKQIEAVRDLTSANAQWETEAKKTASDLEDARDQVGALKISLESAYKELADSRRQLAENSIADHEENLSKEQEARKAVEEKLRLTVDQNRTEVAGLYKQIDELRVALSSEERSGAMKEEQMRKEREELLRRLTDSETRHEELSGSVSTATRPLLRQIESLQVSLKEAQTNSDRMERSMNERFQQTTLQLASVQERERAAAEQYRVASAKVSGLESRLKVANDSLVQAEAKAETLEAQNGELERYKAKESTKIAALRRSFVDEIDQIKREKQVVEATLDAERSALSGEKTKLKALTDELSAKEKKLKEVTEQLLLTGHQSDHARRMSERHGSLSPTPSQSASQAGDYWLDEAFDRRSAFGRNSVMDSMLTGGSALMESIQAQLKQKEGEVVQLQMEVSGLERVRERMTAELAKTAEAANMAKDLGEQLNALRSQYAETEQKYQTMLTMYGEKVEETEELRLDLADVKEMYKNQIQELIQSGN